MFGLTAAHKEAADKVANALIIDRYLYCQEYFYSAKYKRRLSGREIDFTLRKMMPLIDISQDDIKKMRKQLKSKFFELGGKEFR